MLDLPRASIQLINKVIRFAEQHRDRELLQIAEDGVIGTGYAMSSTCKDKEGAWSFLRQYLLPQYADQDDGVVSIGMYNFCTNKADFDLMVEQAMESSVQRHFISGYELLLFDLYRQARGQSLPYRIRETRAALAQRLNLNLRTLYRYTQQLVLGGYAKRVHGKLEIDRSAFRRLETQAVQIAGRF